METPTISIFIVNYNTCSFLKESLRSIFDTKGELRVEVFVADNNSTDGSVEMVKARFPQVFLTSYSENVGYTKAINPLLPIAKGDYYLVLHPDVEVLPNTLQRLVGFLEHEKQAGIVGANLYYPDVTPNPCEVLWPGFKNDLSCFAVRLFSRAPWIKRLVANYNPTEWSREATSRVTSVWNACMMIRREVFETIGYFDEDFFYGAADWDLCKRANEAGWEVHYVHQAHAIHYERQSFSKEDIIKDEVRYKVEGWHSAPWQYRDRNAFLRKHSNFASIYAVRAIYVAEKVLQLWLIMGNLLLQRVTFKEASFRVRACLQTIQSILQG